MKNRATANALSGGAYFVLLFCVSDMVIGQIRYSVLEELEIGAYVGNIAEDLRIGVRELSARKFQLFFDDVKQYFEVNMENGILFVNERIDREQLCSKRPTCSIYLELALETPFEVFPVKVEILDTNDNSPIFPTRQLVLQVSESSSPGTRFPLESAQDPDVGTNTISTYQISSNDYFGLTMQTRNDGRKIAELMLTKPLDREEQSSFELILTAADSGVPQRSGTVQIVITVTDVNDNAPVFDHGIYRTSVFENTPKGTLVVKLHAIDLDAGTNAEFKYSFSNYASQSARELFNFDPESGEIRVQGSLDYEKSDIYEVDVQAVDNAPNVGHAKVLVTIVDVNDNAPEIKLTSVIKMVPEDAAPGTLIAVFSILDRDSGENGQVRCQIPSNVPFKLETTLKNNYKLVTADVLDRETTALYNLLISAWDAGLPALSSNNTITFSVSDINDNVPRFMQTSYDVYLTENNTPGVPIFSVTALDPDMDRNGDVSYSILQNAIQGGAAPDYFTINSKNGNIYALRSFDYEQLKNFKLKIQAQDDGSPRLSSTAVVSIIILDQNDNAPLIISPLIWNSSATVDTLPQSIYPGYLVTKVMANDADSGQNARLSYELTDATDDKLFTMDHYSGEIRTTRSFTQQDATTQRLVVLVKDNGQPSLSSMVTILFSISVNVTEYQPEFNGNSRQSKYFSDQNMYLIILFASTSFIFLLTIILLVALKYKQEQSNLPNQSPTIYCCCIVRNSGDAFNRRSAPKESVNYHGDVQLLPFSETYRYTVRLSPESSKSDFLFLKACHPTLPLSDITVGNTSSAVGTAFTACGRIIYSRLQEANLLMNLAKCEFAKVQVTYQGHNIGHDKNKTNERLESRQEKSNEILELQGKLEKMKGKMGTRLAQSRSFKEKRYTFLFMEEEPKRQHNGKKRKSDICITISRTMANTVSGGAYYILVLSILDLVFGQIRYSIPEELEIGAFVGNIADDLKINVQELSVRKFQLLSEDGKKYFEVNVENGILIVNERIDREHICMERSTCSISLELGVENPVDMFPIEVKILDVNDNSPIFPTRKMALQIAESVTPGTRFPLESAQDPDVGTNTVSTYQISSNEHFGLEIKTINDGSKIAELLLEKPLDREQQSSFELILTAIDGGIPHRTGTAQIIITVADVSDNAPVFDHETYRASVVENAPKGTLVIKLHATDLDEGANAEFKYSFSNYASQRERELFSLNADTGEIRVKGLLDFETADLYELEVQAVDNALNVGHAKVLVRIVDVNDNAPEIKLNSVSKMVSEDAAPGTVVAVFRVTDRDTAENGRVRCQIPLNMPFKLQTTLTNHYKLVTTDMLDRETIETYNVSISAWDAGSPALSANKTIAVFVSDINDNAPRFTQSKYNLYLMENNTPGVSIFSVTALDADLDQNGDISYSMLEDQIQDIPASAYFTINSKSGIIYALRSFDYEQLKKFHFKVQAQDAGIPPLSTTAVVNVIILDQNDNAPLIVSPLTWNNTAEMVIVSQSTYPGYLVTKVIANDADSGQNARLSYELVEATNRSLVTVGHYSGEIRITRTLTAKDITAQRLVVLVKDNGQPSLSSTLTILFTIQANTTESPADHVDHFKNTQNASDLNMYLIIIFGSTSVIFLATIIFLIALKCKNDRTYTRDHSPSSYSCCTWRNSNDVFNRRPAPKQALHYYGAGQTLPVNETLRYTVRLSPESSKSDFLFLKTSHPTLPLSDITVHDNITKK
ncbi:uncharacterized protein LOC121281393 [Carcharodon carcharias]|uniref:uncharacterized protein LOC121281393 n=1 Tax=Carcharodon carcharias TaxID=13397 RepID=UPI001B7F498D|nr:uncharacterized protein LOC121281393 [Carcharodon carcharias]